MSRLTVTAKGQVTLKKEVLQHLGVAPGDQIEVDLLPNRKAAVRAAKRRSIEDFFGALHDPNGPSLTIDEINEVTREAWADRR